MKRLIALTLTALFASSAVAQQAPLRPESFTYRGVINFTETGPFYQVPLPLPVYQGVTRDNLGDLRVFNGQGELLPYALLRSEAQTVSQQLENAAPIFPLLSQNKASVGSGASDVSVTVRQGADGTLVSVQPARSNTDGTANTGNMIKGVVIDASAFKGSIRSLRLVTGANASTEPFHSYSIESSNDLQSWRTLKYNAQLVHLEHNGQRVDNDEAEWDGTADRYLRILWDNPQQAPEIKSVLLRTVETSFTPPIRIWTEEIAPSTVKPEYYEYTWAGQMPLEKLRINLPQVNTLASLSIQNIHRRFGLHHSSEQQYWGNLTQTVVYRYQSPQGEAKSADIALYGPVLNNLRLVVDPRSGSIGNKPPTLQIGFVPHVLVFLARGEGPFVLAWGAKDVESADMPALDLVPGYSATNSLKASPATLAVSSIVQQKPTGPVNKPASEGTSSTSKWILWVVLLAGLLVLGGMAWSLSKQLRQPPAPKL
jgi:hypothetical protein